MSEKATYKAAQETFQPPSGPPPGHQGHQEQFQAPPNPPPQLQQQQQQQHQTPNLPPDDPMWCLQGYDIVYIVDDSTLMSWVEKKSGIVPWGHARDALMTFSSMCAAWDSDGQDMYFINSNEPVTHASPQVILQVFNLRSPRGGTNMGRRLHHVASDYFADYRPGVTKPVNVIAITDGAFSDDVVSVIKWIIQELDRRNAMPNQFGVQFVQIGADPGAKRSLEKLDDELGRFATRDIVDTVPWLPGKVDGAQFDGGYLVKVVCGAINKRLDNKNVLKNKTADKKKKSGFRKLFG